MKQKLILVFGYDSNMICVDQINNNMTNIMSWHVYMGLSLDKDSRACMMAAPIQEREPLTGAHATVHTSTLSAVVLCVCVWEWEGGGYVGGHVVWVYIAPLGREGLTLRRRVVKFFLHAMQAIVYSQQ